MTEADATAEHLIVPAARERLDNTSAQCNMESKIRGRQQISGDTVTDTLQCVSNCYRTLLIRMRHGSQMVFRYVMLTNEAWLLQ